MRCSDPDGLVNVQATYDPIFRGPDGAVLAIERAGERWASAIVRAPDGFPAIMRDRDGEPAILVGHGWAAFGTRGVWRPWPPYVVLRVAGSPQAADIATIVAFARRIGAKWIVAEASCVHAITVLFPGTLERRGTDTEYAAWIEAIARILGTPGARGAVRRSDGGPVVHLRRTVDPARSGSISRLERTTCTARRIRWKPGMREP